MRKVSKSHSSAKMLSHCPSTSSAYGVVMEVMEEEDEKEGQWEVLAVARVSCPNTSVPARCETRTRCCSSPTSSSTPLAAATCGRTLALSSAVCGQRMTSPAAATVTLHFALGVPSRELALEVSDAFYHAMVRAEVVQAVDVSVPKQIVDVPWSTVEEVVLVCFFPWCLTKALVAPSAPTGLAVRPWDALWASRWILATLRRTQLPFLTVSVASRFPSFRLAGRVLTEHLTKICIADPSAKMHIGSLSVPTWATRLLEGLRVQDAVASRCTLSPSPSHFVQLVPVLLEFPWCGHCGRRGSLCVLCGLLS